MTSRLEKVKVIANAYFEQKDTSDQRSRDEIIEHMTDWARKGHLGATFIDGCHAALFADDKMTQIQWLPELPAYNYLTGDPEAFAALAKSKGPVSFRASDDNKGLNG